MQPQAQHTAPAASLPPGVKTQPIAPPPPASSLSLPLQPPTAAAWLPLLLPPPPGSPTGPAAPPASQGLVKQGSGRGQGQQAGTWPVAVAAHQGAPHLQALNGRLGPQGLGGLSTTPRTGSHPPLQPPPPAPQPPHLQPHLSLPLPTLTPQPPAQPPQASLPPTEPTSAHHVPTVAAAGRSQHPPPAAPPLPPLPHSLSHRASSSRPVTQGDRRSSLQHAALQAAASLGVLNLDDLRCVATISGGGPGAPPPAGEPTAPTPLLPPPADSAPPSPCDQTPVTLQHALGSGVRQGQRRVGDQVGAACQAVTQAVINPGAAKGVGGTEPVPGSLPGGLALYGQADHASGSVQLGWREGLALALRALFLLLAFGPFLTLGVPLLLWAMWALSVAVAPAVAVDRVYDAAPGLAKPRAGAAQPAVGLATANRAARMGAGDRGEGKSLSGPWASSSDAADAAPVKKAARRFIWLRRMRQLESKTAAEVHPSIAATEVQRPGRSLSSRRRWEEYRATVLAKGAITARKAAWQLLLLGCRSSGAAFIKWGQWAASRGDLFPPDFCETIGTLHDKAPAHSFAHTRLEVERSLGASLEDLFLYFDPKPLASGSIAQVHRAQLADPLGSGRVMSVVVKVRHPGVASCIQRDFLILKPLAGLTSRVRLLRALNLRDTLAQFSHTMTAQADLRVEAAHLARFATNFAGVKDQVVIPQLFPSLLAEAVMVESYEAGRSVSHICKTRTAINSQIAALGVDTYLAMLLKHNFVHTDLHPGNILVRMVDAEGRVLELDSSPPPSQGL
ncbi:ABC1 family-domain-containing protein, partial [Haematococcus lacustris]